MTGSAALTARGRTRVAYVIRRPTAVAPTTMRPASTPAACSSTVGISQNESRFAGLETAYAATNLAVDRAATIAGTYSRASVARTTTDPTRAPRRSPRRRRRPTRIGAKAAG